jgi:prevent-host-death family protein
MKTLPLAEVKTHLSSLLKEVETGSEIAISFGKKRETIAVIVPYKEYKRSKKRRLGTLKGKMKVIFRKDFSMTDSDLIKS